MALSSLANSLGLSLLLCSSIAVNGAHHLPAEAPHPPPPPPRHPPPPPPRRKVVIEGIVQCIYCVEKTGPGSPTQAVALLPGAVVKLLCNNKKKGSWEEETTTDNNGSFTFRPTKVTTWGAHKCKVSLVSSPRSDCSVNDNYYFEDTRRAFLTPIATNTTSPFQLFSVGPFWFDPTTYLCRP